LGQKTSYSEFEAIRIAVNQAASKARPESSEIGENAGAKESPPNGPKRGTRGGRISG
jgi:hypothetical protein